MRVIAVDGSVLRGGNLSSCIEAACLTAENSGAEVARFRLYESWVASQARACTGQIDSNAPIEELALAILDADAMIIGVCDSGARPDAAARALLHRLAIHFAGRCLERGIHGRPTRLAPGPRILMLTSSNSPRALGRITGTAPVLRRTFATAGVSVLAHETVPPGSSLSPPGRSRERCEQATLRLMRELRPSPISRTQRRLRQRLAV